VLKRSKAVTTRRIDWNYKWFETALIVVTRAGLGKFFVVVKFLVVRGGFALRM